MSGVSSADRQWNERCNAAGPESGDTESMFRLLFERSGDAIILFDPQNQTIVDCNPAAVTLMRAPSKERLLHAHPAALAPASQPDGRASQDAVTEITALITRNGGHRFEWLAQRFDGTEVPLEITATPILAYGRGLHVIVSRDISERKSAEEKIRQLNATLEQRVVERTTELASSEARLRTLVELQKAMFQISEAAHAAGDLDSLYARIHQIISGLLAAKNFYIALLDPATELISFPYFVDELAAGPPDPRKITTGLTGQVLRTGKPLLVTRSMLARKRQVGEAVIIDGVTELPFIEVGRPAACWVGVPLLFGSRTRGVMAVQDYHDEAVFGEDAKAVLVFIAEQTALAIERKRAEEELRLSAANLRESEARFRSAFYSSPVRTSLARVSDGRFIEVNDAFLDGLGLPRAEVIGKDSIELDIWTNPADRAAFWNDLKRDGVIRQREVTVHNQRGRVYTMLLSADILEIRGEPHVLVSALDITERKQAEQELLRALTREKELSQLKSNFVSLVSHEFRTPLGVISSSSEILRDYLAELPEVERREHLDSIARNTLRMSELMEEVLVLGRLDAGKMAFEPAPLDLAALCHGLVEEVLSATNRVCAINLALGSLPADACADARLLRHILLNLLVNAVKYSELGGKVDFAVRREGTQAVFTIRDRGIGIPDADQPRLFNAFQRAGNVAARHGSGLGLVIVKRCVDLHGGNLHLASKVGQGTSVTVSVPVFPTEGRVAMEGRVTTSP